MKMLSTKRMFSALMTVITVFCCCAMPVKQTYCNIELTEEQLAAALDEYYSSSKYENGFTNPSNEYRWNAILHNLEPQLAAGNLGSVHATNWVDNGQGGIVTQVNPNYDTTVYPNTTYLDVPGAFDRFNAISKEVIDYGDQQIWLYDEKGYPSGTAGGKTLDGHDEYKAMGMGCVTTSGWGTYITKTINVGNLDAYANTDDEFYEIVYAIVVEQDTGKIFRPKFENGVVSFGGTSEDGERCSGYWVLYIFATKELYEGTHAQNNGSHDTHYINIMDKDAVGEFISNTYMAYSEHYDYFDRVVGIFTDEPSLMEKYQNTTTSYNYRQIAWSDDFAETFEQMHGYSILDNDNLYKLFDSSDTSVEAKIIRVNYRQTAAKLVSQNYFKQLNDYCVENGTKLSGHAVLEEQIYDHVLYYGDLMQCLRQMGIPGVDSLWADPSTYFTNNVFMSVKYATSAETLIGKDRMTMVEFCATDVPIDYDNVSIAEEHEGWIRSTLNLMLYQGITNINSYFPIECMGTVEERKALTDYLARLTYMSRQAKWDGDIGLYYPVNSQQAYSAPTNSQNINTYSKVSCISTVAKTLYQNNLDFTVVDNEFILEAEIGDGILYNNNVSFKVICMPAVEVIPYDVLDKLLRFEESGGRVYWIEAFPSLPDKLSDLDRFGELAERVTEWYAPETAVAYIKSEFGYNVSGETANVYVGKYKIDGATMYWLYNYNDSAVTIDVSTETTGVFDVYDPSTGDITQFSAESCSVTLDGNYAKLVIVEDALSEKYFEVSDAPFAMLDNECGWLVVHNMEKMSDAALTYDGNKMYWSDKYDAYCYVVFGSEKPDVSNIGIIYGEQSEAVGYYMDTNGSYRIDTNDAQFIYNIYCKPDDDDYTAPISALTYLNADMNGDRLINVEDAIVIIQYIFEKKQ